MHDVPNLNETSQLKNYRSINNYKNHFPSGLHALYNKCGSSLPSTLHNFKSAKLCPSVIWSVVIYHDFYSILHRLLEEWNLILLFKITELTEKYALIMSETL
jgi:hypothetical protein